MPGPYLLRLVIILAIANIARNQLDSFLDLIVDSILSENAILQHHQQLLVSQQLGRFSTNTQLNVDRGLNILNCWSPQRIAVWIYDGVQPILRKHRTWGEEPESKLLRKGETDASKIRGNDTVFVSFSKLQEFTRDFLPHINSTFVLIAAPWHLMYPDWEGDVAPSIIEHKSVLQWFTPNIGNYTGGYQSHHKVSPFPIGLKPMLGGTRDFRNPLPFYRKAFLRNMNQTQEEKSKGLFVGYIAKQTNPDRATIPSGPSLDYESYLNEMAQSKYVISPDGDHPDCHRHYEALGLGAIPITQLDPFLYRHLQDEPVIFANTNWNLTYLTSLDKTKPLPKVNRNIVFEEYWLEYVERVVGRPLQWWDVVAKKKSRLADFQLIEH